MSFLKFFGIILFSTLLYTLMSVLIFYLMSRDLNYLNTIKKLFVAAVYAGFPGILIASSFPAFRLPLLDYQTVYLVCFLIYFFIIINHLETKPGKGVK
jgi:hypothetical protein